MHSTPELLVDPFELRSRPLKIAELLLTPASSKATESIRTHALRAEPLSEQVDDRLVKGFASTAFLAFQGVSQAGWKIPDRQCLDGRRPFCMQ